MSNMEDIIREEARLVILKALAEQVDERLNSGLIQRVLEGYAISRERAWVHDELRWLAQMGAVELSEAGSVLIAALTEKGTRHLARTFAIEGIKRPSRPGA